MTTPSFNSVLDSKVQVARGLVEDARAYDESIMKFLRQKVAGILGREYARRSGAPEGEISTLYWETVIELSPFTYAQIRSFLEHYLSHDLGGFRRSVGLLPPGWGDLDE